MPSSQIGCLIGRGGAIISEMRSATRASIRIFSNENLPKVAFEDEEMVQVNLVDLYLHKCTYSLCAWGLAQLLLYALFALFSVD